MITMLRTVDVDAQRIAALRVDTLSCVGDTVRFDIGRRNNSELQVLYNEWFSTNEELGYLVDQLTCATTWGTFNSVIQMTGFDTGAVITSAEQINFVRINLEHSRSSDVAIALQCPNGQTVAIKSNSAPNSASDSANDYIPPVADAPTGGNMYLGMPVSDIPDDPTVYTDACDTSLAANAAGRGWNYCWSNNTTNGYNYSSDAQNTGYMEYGSVTIDTTFLFPMIDSSDLWNGLHFYHPHMSFDSLVGCPMNGSWTLRIKDMANQRNGYVFEWELSLDSTQLAAVIHLDSCQMTGDGIIDQGGYYYGMTTPEGTTGDTTMSYNVRLFFSNGQTVDTSFKIHFRPVPQSERYDTLCSGDTAVYGTVRFTNDTVYAYHETGSCGCDSIVVLHYHFLPSPESDDTLYFCKNEPFMFNGRNYGGEAVVDTTLTAVNGCDSTVHMHLTAVESLFAPGLEISDDGAMWYNDTLMNGCDPYTLYVRDTSPLVGYNEWYFGDGDSTRVDSTGATTEGVAHVYDSVGIYTIILHAVSIRNCVDTTLVRGKAVRVWGTPEASFNWEIERPPISDPYTRFINLSTPEDSLYYEWYIEKEPGGATDTASEVNPYYRWTKGDDIVDTGDYGVKLIAYWDHMLDNGDTLTCSDTSERKIKIISDYLQFPNMVTPNGDGVNDRWIVVNMLECGYYKMNEVWIYNSWGVLVFHARNIAKDEEFWDPNQTNSPDGTYYYRFIARSKKGPVKRSGTIEVIR